MGDTQQDTQCKISNSNDLVKVSLDELQYLKDKHASIGKGPNGKTLSGNYMSIEEAPKETEISVSDAAAALTMSTLSKYYSDGRDSSTSISFGKQQEQFASNVGVTKREDWEKHFLDIVLSENPDISMHFAVERSRRILCECSEAFIKSVEEHEHYPIKDEVLSEILPPLIPRRQSLCSGKENVPAT